MVTQEQIERLRELMYGSLGGHTLTYRDLLEVFGSGAAACDVVLDAELPPDLQLEADLSLQQPMRTRALMRLAAAVERSRT